MPLKIRTLYYKVSDMAAANSFWQNLLDAKPAKAGPNWSEFHMTNIRLGFLLNDMNSKFSGANGAFMMEFPEHEIETFITRARGLGAQIVEDNLTDPELRSIVLACPQGIEFEVGIQGTHH